MMGVELTDENGERLETVSNFAGRGFDHLLRAHAEEGKLLGYINPYGDTVFNRLQIDDFLTDWNILIDAATTADVRDFLTQVQSLAVKCRDTVHLYLKFVGE